MNTQNIYSTVLEYLHNTFPAPCYVKTNKYEVGTVLYTANPFVRTNGTIIQVIIEDSVYEVLTDIGNVVHQSKADLEKYYIQPLCKRSTVFPEDPDEHFSVLDIPEGLRNVYK